MIKQKKKTTNKLHKSKAKQSSKAKVSTHAKTNKKAKANKPTVRINLDLSPTVDVTDFFIPVEMIKINKE